MSKPIDKCRQCQNKGKICAECRVKMAGSSESVSLQRRREDDYDDYYAPKPLVGPVQEMSWERDIRTLASAQCLNCGLKIARRRLPGESLDAASEDVNKMMAFHHAECKGIKLVAGKVVYVLDSASFNAGSEKKLVGFVCDKCGLTLTRKPLPRESTNAAALDVQLLFMNHDGKCKADQL